MRPTAYLTDVEGQWAKVASFADGNPCVALRQSGELEVASGKSFVFGGDAVDRGPDARRIVDVLRRARQTQPDRVCLIAGNRDINKLRLARELRGAPPLRAPDEVKNGARSDLLRWILANTMAAPRAFEHRRGELGARASDDDVVQSFLDDLEPDGALTRYLAACRLSHREGDTLFVHGAVTAESLFAVPGETRATSVAEWTARLDAWYLAQITAYRERAIIDGAPAWGPLVAYQAPVPGTKQNQASVVYGRLTDADNNPYLPPREVVTALRREGIERLVVGHSPSGDTPSLVREDGFELVSADNSYGRVEVGSQVLLDDHAVKLRGTAELDGGARAVVSARVTRGEPSCVGRRDRAGYLVKGRLEDGDYLLYRGLPGYRMEQIRVAEAEVEERLALRGPR